MELFTRYEITIASVTKDHLSWYFGSSIGYALGAEEQSELPEPFANPSEAEDDWFD